MLPATPEKSTTTPIPVQLSASELKQFILPHLSLAMRGPKRKLGYHGVFNLIAWVLYTGMQWQCLPVLKDSDGKAEIHYTTVYKVFARWSGACSSIRALMTTSISPSRHGSERTSPHSSRGARPRRISRVRAFASIFGERSMPQISKRRFTVRSRAPLKSPVPTPQSSTRVVSPVPPSQPSFFSCLKSRT